MKDIVTSNTTATDSSQTCQDGLPVREISAKYGGFIQYHSLHNRYQSESQTEMRLEQHLVSTDQFRQVTFKTK